jgi:RNA polymerase-binding transcription factor DksA
MRGMKNQNKLEDYKRELEARVADLDRSIRATEREARALGSKNADVMDQASAEYEKQVALQRASTDRQLRKNLLQALERMVISANAPIAEKKSSQSG